MTIQPGEEVIVGQRLRSILGAAQKKAVQHNNVGTAALGFPSSEARLFFQTCITEY
jgi:hypothetical protein